MLFCFLLLLLVHWPTFLLFFLLLEYLDLPHFLRQHMIVILSLKLIPIKCINSLANNPLIFLNFFISLVHNIRISFHFLLNKFDHQHAIFSGLAIKEYHTMRINSLIKDYVFYLATAFAVVSPQLVDKNEEEFEFKLLVFWEFQIVHERCGVFVLGFCQLCVRADWRTIFYHNQAFLVEYLGVFGLGYHMHRVYRHDMIAELIIDDQVPDIFARSSNLMFPLLPLDLLLNLLKQHRGDNLLIIPGPLPKNINN